VTTVAGPASIRMSLAGTRVEHDVPRHLADEVDKIQQSPEWK
jgi:hypothetical protein